MQQLELPEWLPDAPEQERIPDLIAIMASDDTIEGWLEPEVVNEFLTSEEAAHMNCF